MAKTKSKIDYEDAGTAVRKEIEATEFSGAFKLPDGFKLYEIKRADDYNFDIIPYRVGKGNKFADEGKVYYHRTYWAHRGVGPDGKSIACLRKNFGKPCPCCEDAEKFKKTMDRNSKDDKDTLRSKEAKLRQIFIVRDRDSRKPKLEILENSYHLFGKQLAYKVDMGTEKNGYKRFFHLSGGMTVNVKFVQEGEGRGWLKATAVELVPRDEDLPESLIDEAPCLDDMIVQLSYDRIAAIMEGREDDTDEDEEDEEESPKKKPAKKPAPKDDEEEEEETPRKKPGTKSKPEPDDDEEEESPKKKPTKKPAPKDDDDDDEEEEEEEGNPAARKDIEIGVYGIYNDERCKVIGVNQLGTLLKLENEDSGEVIRSVPVADFSMGIPANKEKPKTKPGKKPTKPAKEEDDEEDGWEEEDEPKPKKKPK